MPDNNNKDSAYVDDNKLYNKKIKAQPAPEPTIGIDTKETIYDNIVKAGDSGTLDISAIENFTQVSYGRDQIYTLLDSMCEDTTVAAVLETYAEDATETNESGNIVWADSSDPNVSAFVNFVLKSMKVDKNAYQWIYSLIKYGDLYLRLYRKSEYEQDELLPDDKEIKKVLNEDYAPLKEDVNVKAYSVNDHYVYYLEMEENPAEIFELTKFGQSYAYIETDIGSLASSLNKTPGSSRLLTQTYSFNRGDVNVYSATNFVHASLQDNTSRTPEKVQLFFGDGEEAKSYTYKVKRGQSLLYNVFKIWRELALLENSVILNRITKSSIVRVVGVEVGDMDKSMIQAHLQGIKSLMEQKASLDAGKSIGEYTNPGPIENNIYVPTHNGVGALTVNSVGGEFKAGDLTDLEYFRDKFFGGLRVPKQYFGVTDDNAGFSGGQSLSIISSRYAKAIKRIQSTFLQALTDAINLILIDKGLDSYINKFSLKMLPPTTQEELDRRQNISDKVALISDIMNTLTDINDPKIKLNIIKSLLSNAISNTEVINLIQEEIDNIENGKEETKTETDMTEETSDLGETEEDNFDFGADLGLTKPKQETDVEEPSEESPEEVILPTPNELNPDIDFSDNTQF